MASPNLTAGLNLVSRSTSFFLFARPPTGVCEAGARPPADGAAEPEVHSGGRGAHQPGEERAAADHLQPQQEPGGGRAAHVERGDRHGQGQGEGVHTLPPDTNRNHSPNARTHLSHTNSTSSPQKWVRR